MMASIAPPILEAVAAECGVSLSDLTCTKRQARRIVRARAVATLVLRWRGFIWEEIAVVLGFKDRSGSHDAAGRAVLTPLLSETAVLIARRLGIPVPEYREAT